MSKNKLKSTLAWVIVLTTILAVAFIGTLVSLVETSNELDKHKAILDVACDWSGNRAKCKAGLRLLENMDIEDIKDMGI